MGLETGEFIDDLVITNPVTSTDAVTEGSNHIQLLKKVLKQSFPNFDSEMVLTAEQLNNAAIANENESISGTWTFDNTVETGGRFIVPNDQFFGSRESGGTLRDLVRISPADVATLGNANLPTILAGTDITINTNLNLPVKNLVVGSTFVMHCDVDNADVIISGGTSSSLGSVIALRGENHPSEAGDFLVLSNTALKLRFDNSENEFQFFRPVVFDGDVQAGGLVSGSGRIGGGTNEGLQLKGNGVNFDLVMLNRSDDQVFGIVGNQINVQFFGNVTLLDGEIDTVQPGTSAANHHSFFNDNGEIGSIQTSGTVLQINGAKGQFKIRTSGTDVVAFNGSVSTFAGNVILSAGDMSVTGNIDAGNILSGVGITGTNRGIRMDTNGNLLSNNTAGTGRSIELKLNGVTNTFFQADGVSTIGGALTVGAVSSSGDITAFA